MKKKYRFADLSREDKEFHEMILFEEVDSQVWFTVAISTMIGDELLVVLQ